MDISRKFGIMIFSMVPAIIGGCVTYDLSGGSVPAVILFQVILLAVFGAFISK